MAEVPSPSIPVILDQVLKEVWHLVLVTRPDPQDGKNDTRSCLVPQDQA